MSRFNEPLVKNVLLNPIKDGANKLIIISGYATHNMASWHIKRINEDRLPPIDISLTIGMCKNDGLNIDVHEGFKSLQSLNDAMYSTVNCKYIFQGHPVHSKVYIWLKNDEPYIAYAGSANYTQSGFSPSRREYIVECNPYDAYNYYLELENDSIICNHNEIEEHIQITSNKVIKRIENEINDGIVKQNENCVTLSLLTNKGEVGHGSGINWGHRRNGTKRELNQAYISLPAKIARSGFFPLDKTHFSAITDDHKHLILRVEQENDKAITTPLNNSLLGEYIRNRINVPNGAFVTKDDLLRYGRTDITFIKIDDEQFYMDFSVE